MKLRTKNNRPICSISGCTNKAKSKGFVKNRTERYHKYCSGHCEKKYNIKDRRKQLDNSMCSICDWDLGRCDRHRIIFGANAGEYTKII